MRLLRAFYQLIRWPFTTSPHEEELVDRLNAWFGGVPGIKQIALVIVIYPLVQFLLPPRWRFDPYPFVFLVLLITIVSLTSNQWLMNQGMRSSRLTDEDRQAIKRNTETLLHLTEAMREVLSRLEGTVERVEEQVEEIAEEVGVGDEDPNQAQGGQDAVPPVDRGGASV